MPQYNQTILLGHLTDDPELRYVPSGTAVTKFGVAVNKSYKNKDGSQPDPLFVDIETWDSLAELCAKYLKKGSPALIAGELCLSRWEDQDGNKRSKHYIKARTVQFLSRKDDNQGGTEDGGADDLPF